MQRIQAVSFRNPIVKVLAGLVLVIFLSLAAGEMMPPGVDWSHTFRPAARALIHGKSPYNSPELLAPYAGAPWGLIPLVPLAILPENIGRGFLAMISLICFSYSALKLGANKVTLLAFLISPPVFHCILNANLDWLPLLGFVLPPQIGLFFLAVKPQMGIAVAFFWFIEAWRHGGWRGAFRVFTPIVIFTGLSFALYGLWPLNMIRVDAHTTWWNASLWPLSIPFGLALAVGSVRARRMEFAMVASPCLSPHVLLHSWSGALASLLQYVPEMLAAVGGLWLLVLVGLL